MPSFAALQEEITGMLNIPDEELDEGQQAAMDEYLAELGTIEEQKIDSFGQFLKLQTETAAALEQEAKRLAAKARTIKNRIDYLKNYYLGTMQNHSIKKVTGKLYTLSIRETDTVKINCEAAALPSEYIREKITIEPDKNLIKQALKKGTVIEHCTLEKSPTLQVR